MKKKAIVAILLTILALTFVSLVSTRVMASVPKPLIVRLESRQDNGATSNLGQIVFAGTSYSLPSDIIKIAGNYSIRYDPAFDYEFVRWETSGGLSVSEHSKRETLATVSGNGTLRAIYKTRPPPAYDVNLMSRQDDGSTSNLGTIVFDGSTYHLPNAAVKPSGTYPASYSPASGYKFVRWETSGGIAVTDSNSQSTAATVTGGGVLRAIYTNQSCPIVYLSPRISTGQTFKVDIVVSNITNLYAWEAKAIFDPTIMAARSLDDGDLLGKRGMPWGWMEKSIDDTNGVIRLNQTLLGDVPGVNGSGVLASVTFKVIKPENSTIKLADVVFVDPLGVVDEDVAGIEIEAYFIPTHDIAVKSVTMAGLTTTPKNRLPGVSEVYPGSPIKVIISNVGNYNETAVNVTLFIIDENLGAPEHYKRETLEARIPPEMDDRIDFIIPFEPDLGDLELYVNYTLIVGAAIDAPETLDGHTLVENNVCEFGYLLIKMTGDVNCDRQVNLIDVFAVAKAFGSYLEQTNYDIHADINADGKIDLRDIFAIAKNFGKTY